MTFTGVPEGYTTVTPWVIGRDTAGLIDYLVAAFGAAEIARIADEKGVIGHAEVRIGDAVVMLFDSPGGWPATPAFLRLYVEDAHATLARAVEAGGTTVTEVTHLAFGDLVGRVRDPFGNLWWIQTRIEEVTTEQLIERMSDPVFTAAMAYVQGAAATALDPV
ncbi:putative glyoxalase superfamily protein PhnB [Nocardiopsis sp. Huas11]|uniref:VOC family protein n=1 Tax=Nocardiopsis sp. Huas11 TaxID=2183912 RepID=UPI000EB16BF3|nr:VOC family protein [Nocardiopsis sp. Huas11]RKS09448.1 putative glyoxalase superfamily protein PhnB [Nocardiopsis sp. Huas11]